MASKMRIETAEVEGSSYQQGERTSNWYRVLLLMGPAFVAGAWRFGPGALTSAVQAGSQYGYHLLWVIVVSGVLMFFYNDMSVRIGLATGEQSLIDTIKEHLGQKIGVLAGVGVFFITLCFSVGNAVGSGIALQLLFGGSVSAWVLASTVTVGILIAMKNAYRALEKMLIALIAIMSLGFLGSAVLSDPNWVHVSLGFIPSIPSDAGYLLIALIGTNFSINSAFYSGYSIHERGLKPEQYKGLTIADTIPGNIATAVMTILVIIVSAAVFNVTGETVNNFTQLAKVLEPLSGKIGAMVFSIGFFAAAFSSMAANASAGGTLLCDSIGWGNKLSCSKVKIFVYGILIFGALVAIFNNGSPIKLIIVAQALTVLVAPFLGILLFILSSKKNIMGCLANKIIHKVFGSIGILVIVLLSLRLIVKLL
ncbi:Nramp family divalent metal transporter [Celerinatantimonas diazotrophica]|uniref:NRAMP (Natural resistance-associated macrophage protein)-like metal ion transporter n=1 Tax=Celerinatantimonas diazotrophica TaxID=412034 RepID=A0A4R1K4D5_9GAMM|nr:Nramp family divalent metal transporter [Celerinatantimonas diazotrophica]TCK58964.1 NRAMP (natural resistance-associated macrophage protein)-like metal ion transporter [Celerinatantimonas diazotrophica]CAG9297598.1 Divalent metal cation transporter MntH [Celerinatantimonas diazotrophica]